ncbi:hypothetical protein AXE65_01710 [Ventosimonas gracilis]|uniref:KfrA N-terminal DNA-binding domain-containing protein n=1 Tax=Ventosimonas gracilis TaxID=1680762 RepID=A0A139SUV7_9GAMM|nr:DNA-binding protein [Ventosimonas gracilis]KXU38367.1 hypothetical protein AXE65_01710 [Ventosimonas gracilis]
MKASKERVFEAAEQLFKSGDKPTLAAVRGILGGGSYTSIQAGLSEWRAQQSAKQTASEAAPSCIGDRLSAFGIEIWRLATDQARERLEAERGDLEQVRAALEVERLEAAQLADKLAVEVEQLKAALDDQAQQAQAAALSAAEALREAREEAAQLRGELGATKEQFAALLSALDAALPPLPPYTPEEEDIPVKTVKKTKTAKKPTAKSSKRRIPEDQELPL